MRLFNLNDVIFSEKLLYLLSKHSKAVVLIVKLAKDKQKLDSLLKRG